VLTETRQHYIELEVCNVLLLLIFKPTTLQYTVLKWLFIFQNVNEMLQKRKEHIYRTIVPNRCNQHSTGVLKSAN